MDYDEGSIILGSQSVGMVYYAQYITYEEDTMFIVKGLAGKNAIKYGYRGVATAYIHFGHCIHVTARHCISSRDARSWRT